MSIEITELDCGGNGVIAMAKGHHDLDEFEQQYASYLGISVDDVDQARHTYMRKTPPPEGYESWMTECNPGRGAFPVTAIGPM